MGGLSGAHIQKQTQKEKRSVSVRHQCRLVLQRRTVTSQSDTTEGGRERKRGEKWIRHRESKVEGEESRQCEDWRGEEIEREMQETMGTATQPFELTAAAAAAASSRSEKPSAAFVCLWLLALFSVAPPARLPCSRADPVCTWLCLTICSWLDC